MGGVIRRDEEDLTLVNEATEKPNSQGRIPSRTKGIGGANIGAAQFLSRIWVNLIERPSGPLAFRFHAATQRR